MTTVSQVAKAMQDILIQEANVLARTLGVIQRQRKFTGASLAQALVFGWLHKPQATLAELAVAAGLAGAKVSPQAVDQRFGPKVTLFFRTLLERALTKVIAAQPACVPLLQRFQGVYIHDGSTINVPDEFADEFPSCGGNPLSPHAALKLQVRFDLCSGQIRDLFIDRGRSSDQASPIHSTDLPRGSLRLADLGYYDIGHLVDLDRGGVYWISRIQRQTAIVLSEKDAPVDVGRWLARQKSKVVEVEARLGSRDRFPVRLIALHAPKGVVRQRLARLKETARRHGSQPTEEQRAWCRWTVLASNVPASMLSLREMVILYRCRWQIELLFKLWKDEGKIDESRSENADRQLCELFVKLLAVLVAHWAVLAGPWSVERSMTKAFRAVSALAFCLLMTLDDEERLVGVLDGLHQALPKSTKKNKSKDPAMHQMLEDPEMLLWDTAA